MKRNTFILKNIFEKHIRETPEKAIVSDITILLCQLTKKVHLTLEEFLISNDRVYINTRSLKHLYDKKPAEELDCLLKYASAIIRFPDTLYKNKNQKRGDICFVKNIKNENYLCSLENQKEGFFVVTLFRLRKESYLKNFEHLWSWKDGTPSS